MCFSLEVSIGSFVFCWAVAIYLLTKKLTVHQKQSIIFLMIFSTMQIADAILWYIGMKKNSINYFVTSFLIPFILSLQVLYNIYIRNKLNSPIVDLGVVLGIVYMFIRFNGYSVSSACNGKLASPIWGSREIQFWELALFAFVIFYPNWKLTLFTILIVFPIIMKLSGGGYGSLWCAISTFVSIYYLVTY